MKFTRNKISKVMEETTKLIKELRKENARLKTLVHHDELTGLLNRRGFKEFAEEAFEEIRWSVKQREKRRSLRIDSFSILFIDLDNFKHINDYYGHEAGDKALQYVAKLIVKRVRGFDIVGRWGGEEIVVSLLGAGQRSAVDIAEDIRVIISSHSLKYKSKKFNLTVSIGVAELKNEKKLSNLIDKADKAMYIAKQRGRNRVVNSSN